MSVDGYMKIVHLYMTLEGVFGVAIEVSAQQVEPKPTPVIIRGVDLTPGKPSSLPVTLVGSTPTVKVASDRPLQVEVPQPLRILADRPIVVETAERPLLVKSVPAVPGQRPGV